MRGSNLSGVTQQFGSKFRLRAHALTRPDGVPMPHDCVQAPETFHVTERTSEARRGEEACRESQSNAETSSDLLLPAHLPPRLRPLLPFSFRALPVSASTPVKTVTHLTCSGGCPSAGMWEAGEYELFNQFVFSEGSWYSFPYLPTTSWCYSPVSLQLPGFE